MSPACAVAADCRRAEACSGARPWRARSRLTRQRTADPTERTGTSAAAADAFWHPPREDWALAPEAAPRARDQRRREGGEDGGETAHFAPTSRTKVEPACPASSGTPATTPTPTSIEVAVEDDGAVRRAVHPGGDDRRGGREDALAPRDVLAELVVVGAVDVAGAPRAVRDRAGEGGDVGEEPVGDHVAAVALGGDAEGAAGPERGKTVRDPLVVDEAADRAADGRLGGGGRGDVGGRTVGGAGGLRGGRESQRDDLERRTAAIARRSRRGSWGAP